MKTTRTMLAASFALLTCAALGQFALDWSTVDGGGSSSTGGVFTVTGTIGQPDAGAMSGGSFILHGGFWAMTTVVQSPGAPQLSITVTNDTVVLAWPASSTSYQLQEASGVGTTNWNDVATTRMWLAAKIQSRSRRRLEIGFTVCTNPEPLSNL